MTIEVRRLWNAKTKFVVSGSYSTNEVESNHITQKARLSPPSIYNDLNKRNWIRHHNTLLALIQKAVHSQAFEWRTFSLGEYHAPGIVKIWLNKFE